MMVVAPLVVVVTVPEPPVLSFRVPFVVLDGEKTRLYPEVGVMLMLPPPEVVIVVL